jgi:hypothetical protein
MDEIKKTSPQKMKKKEAILGKPHKAGLILKACNP